SRRGAGVSRPAPVLAGPGGSGVSPAPNRPPRASGVFSPRGPMKKGAAGSPPAPQKAAAGMAATPPPGAGGCADPGGWARRVRWAGTPGRIEKVVDEMAASLADVIRRFKRRLEWARGELRRLAQEESRKGVLDPEDQAHRKRCQRMIERLKGQSQRRRSEAQG